MKKELNDEGAARLLVLCARPRSGPEALTEARRLLSRGMDWGSLLPRAEEEGVLPLLYSNLRDLPEAAPPDVLERLRLGYLRSLARNSRISKQLEPFLAAVIASGQEVVLTKGPRLALSAYPDAALRPFWDVDFVVPPAAWPTVAGILARLGFEEARVGDGGPPPAAGLDPFADAKPRLSRRGGEARLRVNPEQAPAFMPGSRGVDPFADAKPRLSRRGGEARLRVDWTYSPYFRKGELVLEFHFNAFGLHFPLREDRAGTPAPQSMPFGATEALVYTPEAELCHLCLHAQQHSYQRLIWLVDVAEMASRPGLDWDRVSEVCAGLKVHAPVFHGLCLANALWPGTVPRDVLSRLRPGPLTRRALRFFWPEADVALRRTPFAWPYYMPTLFSLWERRAPGLAARTVHDIFFPPRTWLAEARKRPERSARLCFQYARRISRPFGLAARRLVRMR